MRLVKTIFGLALLGGLCFTGCSGMVPTQAPSTAATTPPTALTTGVAATTVAPPQPTADPLAALVNGEPILLAEYERQMARYEASMTSLGQDPNTSEGQAALVQARQQVLDWLIEQKLMEQAAAQAGITVSDQEVDAAIQSLIQEVGQETFNQRLQSEGLALEQMREELRQEMIASRMVAQVVAQVPVRTEHIHARHILVSTQEEAQRLLAQLQAGADFGTLAQTYSQDASTRDMGGDLGTFPRGILTSSEVEAAAFALQPGQTSGIVQSALGYHIIQVLDRIPDMEISAENLRLLQDKAVRQWLDDLWSRAEVQRYVATTP